MRTVQLVSAALIGFLSMSAEDCSGNGGTSEGSAKVVSVKGTYSKGNKAYELKVQDLRTGKTRVLLVNEKTAKVCHPGQPWPQCQKAAK